MAKDRLYAYDVVRVVAMVFVIAVHALLVVDVSSLAGKLYYETGKIVFISANALFFFLSGKFNLKVRATGDELKSYYVKRVRGFLIPALVLFFVRTLYELRSDLDGPLFVAKSFVKNSLDVFGGTEYWFVFTLFGFLLVAPFLARMIEGFSDAECKAFVAVGLIYHAALVIVVNMGLEFSWGYLFSGFAFAFCLGSLMSRPALAGFKKMLPVAASLSLVIGVLLRLVGWDYGSLDYSPLYTLFSVGLYVGVLEVGKKAKPRRVVSFMAKHSFSVYLTHMMVLWYMVPRLPEVVGVATVAEHVFVTAIVFVVSLVLAAAIDTVLVKPCQKLFDLACKGFERLAS